MVRLFGKWWFKLLIVIFFIFLYIGYRSYKTLDLIDGKTELKPYKGLNGSFEILLPVEVSSFKDTVYLDDSTIHQTIELYSSVGKEEAYSGKNYYSLIIGKYNLNSIDIDSMSIDFIAINGMNTLIQDTSVKLISKKKIQMQLGDAIEYKLNRGKKIKIGRILKIGQAVYSMRVIGRNEDNLQADIFFGSLEVAK